MYCLVLLNSSQQQKILIIPLVKLPDENNTLIDQQKKEMIR